MGLDIGIKEYKGKDPKGYLIMDTPDVEWDSTRMAIRKQLLLNTEFKILNSGLYYDWEEYYRIMDFEEAYKWSSTLEEKDKNYIENILKILQSNDNYYLEYGY